MISGPNAKCSYYPLISFFSICLPFFFSHLLSIFFLSLLLKLRPHGHESPPRNSPRFVSFRFETRQPSKEPTREGFGPSICSKMDLLFGKKGRFQTCLIFNLIGFNFFYIIIKKTPRKSNEHSSHFSHRPSL